MADLVVRKISLWFLLLLTCFCDALESSQLVSSSYQIAETFAQENYTTDITLELNCSSWREVVLQPGTNHVVNLTDIPARFSEGFVVFQVHSFSVPVQLANASDSDDPDVSVNGTDIGLVSLVASRSVLKWFLRAAEEQNTNATILMRATPYLSSSPVPGGCSFESNLEVAPEIDVTIQDEALLEIRFQPSGLLSNHDGRVGACDCLANNVRHLRYRVFMYQLPNRDLTRGTYVTAIKQMSDVAAIERNGYVLATFQSGMSLLGSSPLRLYLPNVKMHGTLIAVIADVNDAIHCPRCAGATFASAYVPAISYGCDLTTPGSCTTRYDVSYFVLLPLMLLVGFVLAFLGHHFFRFQIALFSFLFFGFVSIVVLGEATSFSIPKTVEFSAGIGFFGALLMLSLWWCRGSPLPSVIVAGLLLGYLFSSTLFSTHILDNLLLTTDMTAYDVVFALLILTPLVFIYWTRGLNIMASSVCGAYVACASLDLFLATDLSIVVWQSILRHVFPECTPLALRANPISTPNILLICAWLSMALFGFVFQTLRERGNSPFPPHRNLTRAVVDGRVDHAATLLRERAPLLHHFHPSVFQYHLRPEGENLLTNSRPMEHTSLPVRGRDRLGNARKPSVQVGESPSPPGLTFRSTPPFPRGTPRYGALGAVGVSGQADAHWPPVPPAAVNNIVDSSPRGGDGF